MIPDIRIQQVAPHTLELRFERKIDPAVHDMVLCCADELRSAALDGVDTVFITYHSVGVHLRQDAPKSAIRHLQAWVDVWKQGGAHTLSATGSRPNAIHRIAVRFGGEDGPDLAELCTFAQSSEAEVIRLFCENVYRVYMTGFIGGFPYLGIVPERLRMPRRAQPRQLVAPGSVGIASYQAGIYPVETPGGWNLIGRTDVDVPSLRLQPGDSIRFVEA